MCRPHLSRKHHDTVVRDSTESLKVCGRDEHNHKNAEMPPHTHPHPQPLFRGHFCPPHKAVLCHIMGQGECLASENMSGDRLGAELLRSTVPSPCQKAFPSSICQLFLFMSEQHTHACQKTAKEKKTKIPKPIDKSFPNLETVLYLHLKANAASRARALFFFLIQNSILVE